MTINENLTEFAGKSVRDYDPEKGTPDIEEVCYRVRLDWDSYDAGASVPTLLEKLAQEPNARDIESLVIGAWDFESSTDSSEIVEKLEELKDTFPRLRALFLGDITYEEQEMSWIQQGDVSALFTAFPNLEILRIRGSDGLSVGTISNETLKHLAFESGGLPARISKSVASAHLPKLEHLELWLGDSGYGYEPCFDDFAPILSGDQFPKLRYLGFKNCEEQDNVAAVVADSPLLAKLDVLDLSMGTLTDTGAEALLRAPSIEKLVKLDIHHHFVSAELIAELEKKIREVDSSDRQEEDNYNGEIYRYIAVSE